MGAAQKIYDEYLATEGGRQRWDDAKLLHPDYSHGGVDTTNAADHIVEGIAELAAPFDDGVEDAIHKMVVAALRAAKDWTPGQGRGNTGDRHGKW